MISLDRYGVREILDPLFCRYRCWLHKRRTVFVFIYSSSKKVSVLRWKEAADGHVLKTCEV